MLPDRVSIPYTVKKVKVKTSHSLIAIGQLGLESHCILGTADERPYLIQNSNPLTAGLTERVFQSSNSEAQP